MRRQTVVNNLRCYWQWIDANILLFPWYNIHGWKESVIKWLIQIKTLYWAEIWITEEVLLFSVYILAQTTAIMDCLMLYITYLDGSLFCFDISFDKQFSLILSEQSDLDWRLSLKIPVSPSMSPVARFKTHYKGFMAVSIILKKSLFKYYYFLFMIYICYFRILYLQSVNWGMSPHRFFYSLQERNFHLSVTFTKMTITTWNFYSSKPPN